MFRLGSGLSAKQPTHRKSGNFALTLEIAEMDEDNDFRDVLTWDDSWFYQECPDESPWAASQGEVPERIKHKNDTETCLISVIWSVNRIHNLLDVPKATT
jgi:hypothetical protein